MQVFEGSVAVGEVGRGCVLTVGNFDGLHLGHRALLAAVRERARALGRRTALYTFDPHPRRVLFPDLPNPRLMTWEQLMGEIDAAGIDLVVREPFTPAFATLSPEEFLRDVIAARVGPAEVFVGRDFHFGKGRAGSVEWLRDSAPALGMRVSIVEQVRVDGSDASSTRVREALAEGDVDLARRCLGRPYTIWGHVVLGDQRGRTLGFPTANLAPENELLPGNGVYATSLRLFGEGGGLEPHAFPSVTNVGTRPTFEAGRRGVEAHLLDWSGDLYGRRVALAFHARIRPEQRFAGPDELKRQIGRDAAAARELLRGGSG